MHEHVVARPIVSIGSNLLPANFPDKSTSGWYRVQSSTANFSTLSGGGSPWSPPTMTYAWPTIVDSTGQRCEPSRLREKRPTRALFFAYKIINNRLITCKKNTIPQVINISLLHSRLLFSDIMTSTLQQTFSSDLLSVQRL